MRIPIVIQMRSGENGAAALGMMLGYYGKFVPLEELREVCISSRNGSSPEQMMDAAAGYGLKAKLETPAVDGLRNMKLPLLVSWKRRYWCVVTSIYRDIISIADPARGEIRMTMEKFAQLYNGTVITLEKGPDFVADGKRESLYSLIRERIQKLRGPMLVLVVLTLLCIVINISMVHIQKNILDTYMKPGNMQDTHEGYLALSLYTAALLAYFLFSLTKTGLINSSSRNISAVSGSSLFKKIFDQPLKFFEQYSAGELMARIDNNISLDNSIMRSLVPRIIDAVMTVVYLLTLVKYNPVMAIACFAAIVICLTATLYIQDKNAIASRSMTTSGNMLSTTILNGMSMIDTIKSTGSERSFYNLWRESMTQANEGKLRTQNISAVLNFVSGIQGSVLQGIQLFLGAFFVLHGNFTLGSMALFQGILNSMLSSLNNCMSSVNTLQTMRTNIERVNDIMNRESRRYIPLPESEFETADKLEGHLSASHVTYRYNKADSPAVDDVSMEVKPGQMVAIVGKTGSGKSTMLKILADLYKAESGEILYSGRPRDEIPDVIFHSSVMTVDQDTMMFEDSVYNNIRMWDNTIENYEVILAARDAQIHDRILNNSKDYGSMIEENGRNYSGGELQRLELARALAHEPTLLFLDEFTSALDALTEDRVIKSIRDKGTTCIIVAHRLSTIVDCDRIYVMDGGKVVQEGTHEELYAQGGLYRELIRS
ncbi:MAG: ATP-binding cassette domain-containing protein [Lachnospiraceae bacterium]|nr:ATP-binding cassette domain-containing protein [Lachnospiraceae bacterium]